MNNARATGAVVEPVIAWERPLAWYAWVPPGGGPYDFAGLAEGYLGRVIDEVVGKERPVQIRPHVIEGHPAAVLDRARGAVLMVVGNRGHGGFTQAMLGSVSQHRVQHATCPVAVVPGPRP